MQLGVIWEINWHVPWPVNWRIDMYHDPWAIFKNVTMVFFCHKRGQSINSKQVTVKGNLWLFVKNNISGNRKKLMMIGCTWQMPNLIHHLHRKGPFHFPKVDAEKPKKKLGKGLKMRIRGWGFPMVEGQGNVHAHVTCSFCPWLFVIEPRILISHGGRVPDAHAGSECGYHWWGYEGCSPRLSNRSHHLNFVEISSSQNCTLLFVCTLQSKFGP